MDSRIEKFQPFIKIGFYVLLFLIGMFIGTAVSNHNKQTKIESMTKSISIIEIELSKLKEIVKQ